jgi:lipopolysaccharide biosynthesis glycosyltransferase
MEMRGIVYVAVNQEKYLEAALTSALCFRRQDLATPITVISDLPIVNHLNLKQHAVSPRLLKPTEIIDKPFFSRYLKTQLGFYSPYRETLYLDADILPINDISGIWSYLDHGDLAMVEDRLPQIQRCEHIAQDEIEFTLQSLPGESTQYNGGVIVWRNTPKVKAFFAKWHQEWLQFGKHDQLALVRAIAQSQLSIAKIPKSYNISPRDA